MTTDQKSLPAFIIARDGLSAWQWTNPSNRIIFKDLSITVDGWKSWMENKGLKIADDRNTPCGNVWN